MTRSPGTILVGFSSRSGSARPPVAKNGRPEPKTTGRALRDRALASTLPAKVHLLHRTDPCVVVLNLAYVSAAVDEGDFLWRFVR